MVIDGFQKLTLLDYPGKVACIIFTRGCNLACPFCHNSSLLTYEQDGQISEQEVLAYLSKRKGILDGIVISGGEPLMQNKIKEFLHSIKQMNYSIKLDTNGTNPELLKQIIDDNLVDYIAMDIKNVFTKYDLTTGCKVSVVNIKKSIELLKNSSIDYEFRTTIVKEFHELIDLKQICEMVGNSKYYLQNFIESEGVLNKQLHGFEQEELKSIYEILKQDYPNIAIRN